MNYQKYQLVVRRGPQEGQIFPLSGDLLTIGRDPMSDITITDPEVSRQHARLTLTEEGAYEVQDLGSTNGTFVDGNRLGGEKVRLSPGQVLIVGSNVTMVYESAPDPMATVIAARDELDFGEFSRPAAAEPMDEPEPLDEPAFMDEPEVVEVDLEPMPESEEPMELPELEPLEPESPQWPAMEEADAMSQAATDRLDDADEPPPYDATIIDQSYQTPDVPSYQPPQAHEPQPLPSFEAEDPMRTMMDSGRETPPPPPRQQSVPVFEPRSTTPPPPPPMDPIKTGGDGGPNRNRNIIIAVVVVLLLCCCCAVLAWFYQFGGDALLQELGISGTPFHQLTAGLA